MTNHLKRGIIGWRIDWKYDKIKNLLSDNKFTSPAYLALLVK